MIKSQKLGSKASDNPFAGKVKQSGNLKYENPGRWTFGLFVRRSNKSHDDKQTESSTKRSSRSNLLS